MSGELFTSDGKRKYLNQEERENFLRAAESFPREVRTFCGVLAFTGCRISEALELTPERIDFSAGVIIFQTLKKRRRGVFRAVPAPPALLDALDLVHDLKRQTNVNKKAKPTPLWSWSRTTAWSRIKSVMKAAGLEGEQANPKGLRHGFGIAAVEAAIPPNIIQKWMGHAQLSTTAIYLDAVGQEEKTLASRMW